MPLTCLLGALAYSLPTRPAGIAPPAFSAPQPPPLLERAPSSPRMVASTTPASTAVAPVKVMIAGGGIGGLCTALVLRKLGFDVAVYDEATLGPGCVFGIEALAQQPVRSHLDLT